MHRQKKHVQIRIKSNKNAENDDECVRFQLRLRFTIKMLLTIADKLQTAVDHASNQSETRPNEQRNHGKINNCESS